MTTVDSELHALHVALHAFRREKMQQTYGRHRLNNLGPAIIMGDSQLKQILECARLHKLNTVEDVVREIQWWRAEDLGADVLRLIQQYYPNPAAGSTANTGPPTDTSTMVEQITLYTSRVCPYAHRVEIALAEAKASYSAYEINLQDKPDWYAPLVNPAGKVPAIAYGGPPSTPSTPSPLSTKLAESLVLTELVADLFPAARLLPASPVARARARLFIDAVSTRFVPAWHAFLHGKASAEEFYRAVEHIQALLPPSEGSGADSDGPFAVGAYSVADVAITPFVARIRVALVNELGAYPLGEGKRVWETMTGSGAGGRFARFGRYCAALLERESFKATFDETYITETQKARHAGLR